MLGGGRPVVRSPSSTGTGGTLASRYFGGASPDAEEGSGAGSRRLPLTGRNRRYSVVGSPEARPKSRWSMAAWKPGGGSDRGPRKRMSRSRAKRSSADDPRRRGSRSHADPSKASGARPRPREDADGSLAELKRYRLRELVLKDRCASLLFVLDVLELLAKRLK